MGNIIEKRPRNFYGLETYLGFPRLNKKGNPDLQVFAKKDELIEFLDAPIAKRMKRIRITGEQALNFGKRTNWRPKGLLLDMANCQSAIKEILLKFRQNNRLATGVKPFLSWYYKKETFRYPLVYPFCVKNITEAMSNYSNFLFDKLPYSLPYIKLESEIIGAPNLRGYIDGDDCQLFCCEGYLSENSFIID